MSTEDVVEKKAEKKPAKVGKGFTSEERSAMRERAKEMKASADKADLEKAVIDKLAEMPEPDRSLGEQLHKLIKASAPMMSSKLWYGMPAYSKDEKIVCFYQPAHKFKARYGMLGFSDNANLDDGSLWPVYYAIKEWTPNVEAQVKKIIKRAVS